MQPTWEICREIEVSGKTLYVEDWLFQNLTRKSKELILSKKHFKLHCTFIHQLFMLAIWVILGQDQCLMQE